MPLYTIVSLLVTNVLSRLMFALTIARLTSAPSTVASLNMFLIVAFLCMVYVPD
jgi:hypothetical protein